MKGATTVTTLLEHIHPSRVPLSTTISGVFETAIATSERRRAVALLLVDLLRTVATDAEITKMEASNLAVCFAPSFLRFPGDDPQQSMFNNDKEVPHAV